MKAVTKLNYETLRAHTETGHHNVSGWDVRKSQESCPVPVSVPHVNKKTKRRQKEDEAKTKRQREETYRDKEKKHTETKREAQRVLDLLWWVAEQLLPFRLAVASWASRRMDDVASSLRHDVVVSCSRHCLTVPSYFSWERLRMSLCERTRRQRQRETETSRGKKVLGKQALQKEW